MVRGVNVLDNTTDRAFVALAEQLKLPLLQIAYLSESKLDDWNDGRFFMMWQLN